MHSFLQREIWNIFLYFYSFLVHRKLVFQNFARFYLLLKNYLHVLFFSCFTKLFQNYFLQSNFFLTKFFHLNTFRNVFYIPFSCIFSHSDLPLLIYIFLITFDVLKIVLGLVYDILSLNLKIFLIFSVSCSRFKFH